MKEWFETNLPWYVNGTLDPGETAEMETYIAQHPEAAAQVESYRRFSESIAEQWQPVLGTTPGLAQALEKIRVEQARSPDTLWQRLRDRLARIGITPGMAGAAAVVVIAVQAVFIGLLQRETRSPGADYSEFRSTPSNGAVGPFIRVSFRPETKEFDIRMLLVGLGATYVGGPSQLGDYYVFVPGDHVDRAVQQLNASHLVEGASVVAKVPPLK